jgi:nucleoside-diphosphate-sugar epimerase
MLFDNILYKTDVSNIAACSIDWEQLKSKNILITGATGQIATFLIDVLMYRNIIHGNNISIYAVGRNKEKAMARFKQYCKSHFFTFIQQDIQLPIKFGDNIDYIIHGASNTHPIAYATDPVNTILLSILGTKNILDFAAIHKVKRTLFLSTVEIYGENRGDTKQFTEDYCGYIDCNTLRAGYPEGKRAAEALCQAYMNEKKLDIIIARCCRVYGPTMTDDDTKVIAQFLRNTCDNKPIILKSNGEQQYSYCYVADVCSALLVMLLSGKSGEAYNISDSNCNMSLLKIAEMLSNYFHTGIVFDVPSSMEVTGFSKATKALLNSTKLQGLGWNVKYPIEEGLIRTVKILKDK